MKIQLSSVPAAVEPLTADLAEETTEISESLEPEQEGGAGTASDHLLTSALTPAKTVQSANFKVIQGLMMYCVQLCSCVVIISRLTLGLYTESRWRHELY